MPVSEPPATRATPHEEGEFRPAGGAGIRRASFLERLARCGSPRAFALGLGGAALVVFVGLALLASGAPFQHDAGTYHQGALNILSGRGYVHDRWPWTGCRAFFPVGYPAFLAGVYALAGPEPLAALAANGVLVAVTVVLSYGLARRLVGEALGRMAALAFALLATTMRMSQTEHSEPLFMVLLYASLLLACGRRTLGRAALAGVPLGLASLVRVTALPAPALFLVIFALLGETWRRAAARALVLGAAALCVVAPWTLRNARVLGHFVPVSTNGGYNLWVGNRPDATGGFGFPHVPADVQASNDEVERDRLLARHAMDSIRASPRLFVARVPARLLYALGFGFCHWGAKYWESRATVLARLALSVLAALLVAVTAFAGARAACRLIRQRSLESGPSLVPLVVLLFLMGFIAISHGQRRFLYPAYPFMAISLVETVAWGIQRLTRRPGPPGARFPRSEAERCRTQ